MKFRKTISLLVTLLIAHQAYAANQLDTLLIDYPIDERGTTALILACKGGQEKVVQTLCEQGANRDAHDNTDLCALDYAAQLGHVGIVKQLLRSGGAVVKRFSDSAYVKPLFLAIEGGHTEVVRLFINESRHPDIKWNDSTVLIRAIELKQSECAKLLLELGANPDLSNKGQTATPLSVAIDTDQADLVKVLIHAGANPNRRLEPDAKTALIGAVQNKNTLLAKLLLESGANPNAIDMHNKTALDYAIEAENNDIMALLQTFQAQTAQAIGAIQHTSLTDMLIPPIWAKSYEAR